MQDIATTCRLFSTYVVIRLFYAHVLPTMSNGPLWYEMRDEAAYCKTSLLEALLTLPVARNQKVLVRVVKLSHSIQLQNISTTVCLLHLVPSAQLAHCYWLSIVLHQLCMSERLQPLQNGYYQNSFFLNRPFRSPNIWQHFLQWILEFCFCEREVSTYLLRIN